MVMKLYASTRPDLHTIYTHASMSVLGWPVHIMFSAVSWDGFNLPGVGVIGRMANDGWRWQDVVRAGSIGIDLYRFDCSDPLRIREERKPWLEVAHAAV